MFALMTALLVTLPPAYGGKAQHRTICQLCGMDAAKSETEFILHRKTEPELHACCVNCARRLMKKLGAEITERYNLGLPHASAGACFGSFLCAR